MAQQKTGQDVTAGAGRRDEVGKSGVYPATGPYPEGDLDVLTPGEINEDATNKGAEGPGVERNEEVSRNRPLGHEEDEPDSDALGG